MSTIAGQTIYYTTNFSTEEKSGVIQEQTSLGYKINGAWYAIGDITIKDYKANLIDLSHVNAAYAATGIPTIDGVLGNDILYNYNAVINYKKATLKLTEKTIKKSTAKKILKLTSKKAKK